MKMIIKRKLLCIASIVIVLVVSCSSPFFPDKKESDDFGPSRAPGMVKGEHFRFEVTVPAGGATFYIPLSGQLEPNDPEVMPGGFYVKPYHWEINWGDGRKETINSELMTRRIYDQNGLDSEGVPHAYTRGGTYTITIVPAGSTDAWFAAFGFYSSADFELLGEANKRENKNMVTRLISPLTPLMTRTQAELDSGLAPRAYEWANTFCELENLTMGENFTFSEEWDNITTVGDRFAYSMFRFLYDSNPDSVFTMGSTFNLPQKLEEVGKEFAAMMFYNCNGAAFTMGSEFNLPQGIMTVGDGFASAIFEGCSGLNFKVNGEFKFPVFDLTVLNGNEGIFRGTFKGLNPEAPQTYKALDIINENPKPADKRDTFTDSTCFLDWDSIPEKWKSVEYK